MLTSKEKELEDVVESMCETAANLANAHLNEFVRRDAIALLKFGAEYLQMRGRKLSSKVYEVYLRESIRGIGGVYP